MTQLNLYKNHNWQNKQLFFVNRMPIDWTLYHFRNLINYEKGKNPQGPFSEKKSDNCLPYLSTEFLRHGKNIQYLNTTNTKDLKIADENVILLLWDGSNAGEFFFSRTKGVLSSTMVLLRPKIDINLIYLFYTLSFFTQRFLKTLTRGTGIPHVDKNILGKSPLLVPPLSEQRAIAGVLSQMDETIEKVEESIAKWKRIKKAAMRKLFSEGVGHKEFKYIEEVGKIPKSWIVKKLADVFILKYGKSLDKNNRNPNGKYPAYGANGIKDYTDKFLCSQQTLIIGRKGSAGEVLLTEEKFWPLDVTYYIEFDSGKHNLMFLYYLLKLVDLTKLSRGVKPGLNRNDVYRLMVSLPPLIEQKQIAGILEKIDRVIELKEEKKKHLEKAKRGAMKLLLTGQIRIKV